MDGVDDWRVWKWKERAAQLRRACGAGREAWDWENSGSADGELVRSEVCTPACFCQKRSELLRAPTQATYRNFRDTPMPVRLLMAQHREELVANQCNGLSTHKKNKIKVGHDI